MDISSHGGEIPMPISSSYGGNAHGQIVHGPSSNNHIIPSLVSPLASNGSILSNVKDSIAYMRVIKYKECLKNHAAAMGGNATDGCGEFMPSGEEGTLEALKCSACNCHRNFHRKDIEGEPPSGHDLYHLKGRKFVGQKGVLIAGAEAFGYPTSTRPPPPHMIMSYSMGPASESDEQDGGGGGGGGGGLGRLAVPLVKKRFRTKFTQEQKEKMLGFAERVGWRIQKQEESVVQQFCQEIGVKRRVLKVWMHNNKHNLAKKSSTTPSST